jgi:dipeptidyl aminopeptidase/acylaminoacyl peptidase
LFTVTTAETASYDGARIEVLELATGARRVVLQGARWARYVVSGHLLFARRGELYAAAFDARTRQLTGDPVPIAANVSMSGFEVDAAASDAGSIAYVRTDQPPESSRRLVWVTRQGIVQPVRDEPGFYLWPRIAPNGALVSLAVQGPSNTIWIQDLERGTLNRVPSQGDVVSPVWMPHGRAFVYSASWEQGNDTLTLTGIDGTGERRVFQSANLLEPHDVSPDGRFAITSLVTADTRGDLWVVPLTGDDKPRPLLQLKGEEYDAKLSPDGKWFVYVSNEAGPGRHEAYVRPFPGPGGRYQISSSGASAVVWSRSGREIFYRDRDRIMAAAVEPGSTFAAGPPKPLFTLAGRYRDEFDVAPDGQRFIMVELTEQQPVTAINMIFDWVEDLKRRGAAR